jgi:phosphoglycolate phosphatase-like HAD superfamily hydrolase
MIDEEVPGSRDWDGLIFDVDGVLIDSDRSYPQVIRTAVQWGWRGLLGGVADCTAYGEAHQRVLKSHKAFNDDYDIPWALLCMAASTGEKRLSRAFPSPEELRARIDGLREGDPVSWIRREFGEPVPRSVLRSLCRALYGGDRRGEWNFPRRGLVRLERPLLSVHFSRLPLPSGIYTGRPMDELLPALEMLGWEDFPRDLIVTMDMGIIKPSPKGLERISRRLGCKSPLFFGDTGSDRTAQEAFGRGTFVAVGPILEDAPLRFPDVGAALEALVGPLPV